MWHIEAAADSTGSPAAVWARYTDAPRWTDWDEGIDWVTIDGPFAVGTRGRLKPSEAPTSFAYEITHVAVNRAFRDVTPIPHRLLPLVRLEFDHEIEATATGSRITHRVAFRGPLGFLFRMVAGKGFERDVPDAVNGIARITSINETVAA